MVVPQVGGVGDAVGPEQWFRSLPVITQYWFGGTLIITLAANFGIVDPAQLVFSWLDIRNQFQLWRLATSFLYVGPFEFGTLIAVYMLVNFSKIYEAGGPYNTGAGGGTADYAFMMLFAMALMLLSYPIIGSMLRLWPLFSRNLIYFVLYVWSKRNPTAQANIWGIPVQGVYLPFAYLALHVFMGSPYMDMLHGMAIGHLYYFLVDVVPQVQGKDILLTPQFLIDHFGVGEYRPEAPAAPRPPPGRAAAAAAAPPAGGRGGGYNWGGAGRPLGRE